MKIQDIFIADIGANHNGCLDYLLELINLETSDAA